MKNAINLPNGSNPNLNPHLLNLMDATKTWHALNHKQDHRSLSIFPFVCSS